jgi:outer membrane protein assembly factor BamB
MFRHDMNRTGNTTSTSPNTNDLIWTHQTPQGGYTWGYTSSPAVSGGRVFIGGGNPDIVRAIDIDTGLQDWQRPMGRVTSSCTVTNGHVFVGSYNFDLYCLVETTGGVHWQTGLGDYIDSSPVVHNGKVYVGTGQGDYIATKPCKFYCVDETNGNILWNFQAQGQVVASPTIVDDRVVFGSYDGNVYCIPADDPDSNGQIDNNEVIWTFSTGERIVSSAAVEDNILYLGTVDGNLYALPLYDPDDDGTIDTEEVIWKFSTGNEIWGSPALAYDRVYIGSHDYYVYCLPQSDPNKDGVITQDEIIWKYRTTDKLWSSPSIAGGKVFIGSEDYTLWALSKETGVLIWNYTMPLQSEPFGSELLYSSPAVVDGKIYIGNYDLTLYCFGNDTDSTPPKVNNVLPFNMSEDAALNTDIEVNFDEKLCSSLITESSLILKPINGSPSTGIITYDDQNNKLNFNPDNDLLPNFTYTVILKAQYFQDFAGNFLDGNNNDMIDPLPYDDFIWQFNTSKLVGHKPQLQDCSVTPESGNTTTNFEVLITYTDEDGDAPLGPTGYIKIYFDGSQDGQELVWANDANIPDSYLIDRDYINGELFHFETMLDTVGVHNFYIECSDGFNTNQTPVYDLPLVLNSPPILDIPSQFVTEDQKYQFDLLDYVNDIDNITSDLIFTENSIYCQIENQHLLSCLYSEESPSFEIINITVTDGINIVWQEVLFIIEPNNDGPALKPNLTGLPSVTVYEDTMYIFQLDDYITDPDTPMELLEVTDDSEYISPIGLTLYLLYTEPIINDTVSLAVTDGASNLYLTLELFVTPVNDPPILELYTITLDEESEITIDIDEFLFDEESNLTDLDINIISYELGTLEVSTIHEFKLFYTEGYKNDYLEITIIDADITVKQIVTVKIKPVNDAPVLSDPRTALTSPDNGTVYTFQVTLTDNDLINPEVPEPTVILEINEEVYDALFMEMKNEDGTTRTYGVTLELEPGSYHYHFGCNDNSGKANGLTHTESKSLTVEINGQVEPENNEPERETESDSFQLVLVIILVIVIFIMILVNLWIYYKTRKPIEQPLPEPESVPTSEEEPSPIPDADTQPSPVAQAVIEDQLEPPMAKPVIETPSNQDSGLPETASTEPQPQSENGGEEE